LTRVDPANQSKQRCENRKKENPMSIAQLPDEDISDTRPVSTDDDREARNSDAPRPKADPRTATDTPATPRIKNN
jgi:hypothetical protein